MDNKEEKVDLPQGALLAIADVAIMTTNQFEKARHSVAVASIDKSMPKDMLDKMTNMIYGYQAVLDTLFFIYPEAKELYLRALKESNAEKKDKK